MALGTLRYGVDFELEDRANDILKRSREGVTALSERNHWLTEYQLKERQEREVYTMKGCPEPHIKQGMYRRAHNPLINKRPVSGVPEDDGGHLGNLWH